MLLLYERDQSMINVIDEICPYSRYYGDMFTSSVRLHDDEEDYAAMKVLFNAS